MASHEVCMARNNPLEDNHPSSPWLTEYHTVLKLDPANIPAQNKLPLVWDHTFDKQ
jgi:hypothetical protein